MPLWVFPPFTHAGLALVGFQVCGADALAEWGDIPADAAFVRWVEVGIEKHRLYAVAVSPEGQRHRSLLSLELLTDDVTRRRHLSFRWSDWEKAAESEGGVHAG